MPPKQSEVLTDAELRVMKVLWERGSGTVQQVLDSIVENPVLAYNSILTTIRILERKGYLKHSKDGRAHVYAPVVRRQDATRSEIRHLVTRFFKDSHQDLVLNILEDQGIEPEELDRLRKMLDLHQNDLLENDPRRHDLRENDLRENDLRENDLRENDLHQNDLRQKKLREKNDRRTAE